MRSHAFLLLLTLIILGVAQVFAGTESSNWTHYQNLASMLQLTVRANCGLLIMVLPGWTR